MKCYLLVLLILSSIYKSFKCEWERFKYYSKKIKDKTFGKESIQTRQQSQNMIDKSYLILEDIEEITHFLMKMNLKNKKNTKSASIGFTQSIFWIRVE